MINDNSSFTVTAPDLYLTDDGIGVLIISQNPDFVDKVKRIMEKYCENGTTGCRKHEF